MKRVSRLLQFRLEGRNTCLDVIDVYEQTVGSIWVFTARLLGDAGTRAVVARSLKLAARQEPLAAKVRATERGLDFRELREYVAQEGCPAKEVLHACMSISGLIFQTLYELTGDSVTEPLLRSLEEEMS